MNEQLASRPEMTTTQRMLRARIRLALSQPFLATALMRLPLREVAHMSWCHTAATDGYHLFFNPSWVQSLSDAELRGVLAHEVLHVLFAHGERRAGRDPQGWNIACDLAINALLLSQGFRLPKEGLLDPRWAGMTAESIYEQFASFTELHYDQDGHADPRGAANRKLSAAAAAAAGAGRGSARRPGTAPSASATAATPGSGDGDHELADSGLLRGVGADLLDPDDPRVRPHRSADAPDAQQLAELRRELRQAAQALLHGTAAGSFRQECRADEASRVDWRALLRAWLHDRVKGDWQSYPFSKRHVHRGLFMPSASLAVPAHVVFAIDTSASMEERALARVAAELRAFRETFPCRLSVLQADAALQAVAQFEPMDGTEIPPTIDIHGRGGTDFRPVFEWIAIHAPDAVVLYATDGFGSFPTQPPINPVIWLLTPASLGAERLPFGLGVEVG